MRVVLDLPSQAEEMLSLIAKERNISQENLLKEMILQYLEDLEDAQKGEQAYNEYLESGERHTCKRSLWQTMGQVTNCARKKANRAKKTRTSQRIA